VAVAHPLAGRRRILLAGIAEKPFESASSVPRPAKPSRPVIANLFQRLVFFGKNRVPQAVAMPHTARANPPARSSWRARSCCASRIQLAGVTQNTEITSPGAPRSQAGLHVRQSAREQPILQLKQHANGQKHGSEQKHERQRRSTSRAGSHRLKKKARAWKEGRTR